MREGESLRLRNPMKGHRKGAGSSAATAAHIHAYRILQQADHSSEALPNCTTGILLQCHPLLSIYSCLRCMIGLLIVFVVCRGMLLWGAGDSPGACRWGAGFCRRRISGTTGMTPPFRMILVPSPVATSGSRDDSITYLPIVSDGGASEDCTRRVASYRW